MQLQLLSGGVGRRALAALAAFQEKSGHSVANPAQTLETRVIDILESAELAAPHPVRTLASGVFRRTRSVREHGDLVKLRLKL